MAMPMRRVSFPKGAVHAGETHRLTDATFVPGSGIEEALAAGAEQVIVVTGVPETAAPLARRRGPLARIDASVRALERQAADEIGEAWRVNRMVSTLGHRGENGRGAWEDPATGRVYGEVDLWVIRPDRRALGPMELDGARDPATEVLQTTGRPPGARLPRRLSAVRRAGRGTGADSPARGREVPRHAAGRALGPAAREASG